jgi:hypothetical protein
MKPSDSELDALIKQESFHHYPGTTVVGCVIVLHSGYQTHGFSIASEGEPFDMDQGKRIARRNARGRLAGLEAYVRRWEKHARKG